MNLRGGESPIQPLRNPDDLKKSWRNWTYANDHERQGRLAGSRANRDEREAGIDDKWKTVDEDCTGCEEIKIKHGEEEDTSAGGLVIPNFPDGTGSVEQGPSS